MKKWILLIGVVLVLFFLPRRSDEFAKGYYAFFDRDFETALLEWEPIAEQGDKRAQYFLGQMYLNGFGVLRDYDRAHQWLNSAVEQGFAPAQSLLGIMYHDGNGVPQDDAEAAKMFRLAAEQGFGRAQLMLGFAYAAGRGVPLDYRIAYMWGKVSFPNGGTRWKMLRDLLGKEMTRDELKKANKLATQCERNDYKNCG